jgi:hypothetical protein
VAHAERTPRVHALTAEQKLLILTETCEALVREDVPAPDHTAVNEGTVAALFAMLRLIAG